MTVWVQDRGGRQDASARRPVVDSSRKKAPLASTDGLRWSMGRFVLILVAAVLACILVADAAGIGSGNQSISKLSSRIGRLENRNQQIRNEIELSLDLATINEISVRQDLVSSHGVPTISLTAPDNLR